MKRAVTIIIGWLACAELVMASSSALMFPIPRGAETPRHDVIAPKVAEEDSFWMNASYPATPALDHYLKNFAAWVPCKSQETGWSSYGDLANGADRLVHQFKRHWISHKNDRAITLIFQYVSPGTANRKSPDNDRQFVAIIQHRVADAAAFLAEMKVACPNSPNSNVDTDAHKNGARRSQ